ncbi:amino acid permease [Conexibacter sp. SYSU D00693]|uniref:amino acid permease n=1 Tax=Conexibacter sp. SYSU D00693 TaxID=2812560 RepID=UPI00196A50DF|nr:amino acid permease [Conexibacter sp. SYSU D00693]
MPALLGPRKTIEETLETTEQEGFQLKRALGAFDVLVLGIGVIVGSGIFVLTGQAAAKEAGPAISLSFVLAAVVCGLAALCYAEFAAMVPAAGSAYTFAYVTLGQLVAFIIGWDLVLEFTIGASAVAVGFAGYLDALLDQVFGVTLPEAITAPPGDGGSVNVFAMAVVGVAGVLLIRGVRQTARSTAVLVGLTILVLLVVIAAGATEVDTDNWKPFSPFGWDGIVGGASLVFFAYIGFDIVATTAEEAKRPQRDVPIGIIGSLAIVTVLYVVVSLVLTGMEPYRELGSDAPVADAFKGHGLDWIAAFVYAGACIAILKTVMILMLGQSRVAFAMARDRLLPPGLASTHERFGTPHRITLITMVVVALLAGFLPLSELAKLVNIGTLFAFAVVSIGVLYLRWAEPERERPFRTPMLPLVSVLSVVGCVYLAADLEAETWIRFVVWMAIGLVVYVLYSRSHSRAGHRAP